MKKKNGFFKRLWYDRALVMMAMPAVILLVLFNYIPMTGLVLAFKNFDFSLGLYKSPWCGFENFRYLFLVGDTFWKITRNTVGYYIAFTAIGVVTEVLIAIGINELVFKRAGKIMQSIMIMPTFISYVAVSYIVYALLRPNIGMIPQMLTSMGAKAPNFYMTKEYWPFILIIVNAWKNAGYGSVLYLATLTGIDPELYEAASLDGANVWHKMRYITIPMLSTMIVIKVLLGLGNIMHSNTGLFYQVTRNMSPLYDTTQVLDSYVLNSIMTSVNYGASSATTFYQSVVGLIMVVSVNLIVRKISPEHSLF